jgi:phytoene desaturase
MEKKKAVIIGGGLGGLATALRLAQSGWKVTVCEQSASFGGKMNSWQSGGFRFDTGPSLITMPWIFADLFEFAGSSLEKHVELTNVTPLADYVFADGARFTYSTNLPEWLETIRRIEPRDVDGFLKFMQLGARLYALSKETFLRFSPFEFPDLKTFKSLRAFPVRYAWGNYHRAVAAHFRSPYLRQLFERYPTYVGSSPYASPATLAVIPYIEYAFGGWHVRGGLYRLIESILTLAQNLNVELLTNARVEQIKHDGRKISGVTLAGGKSFDADVIIMNGDASTTNSLLGKSGKEPPAETRSLSGFVLLAGLRKKIEGLSHHTIYFSGNYRREFSQLFDEKRFPDDPTVYVCAPSRTDSTLAPAGGETLFIMANAPANGDDAWTDEQTVVARERVFRRLSTSGFREIASDTIVSDTWTPQRIGADYLMPGGAIYGAVSHGWKGAFLRPPNKDRGFKGLYYVGGSTHPGGGTPTVLLSAKITCNLIGRHEN